MENGVGKMKIELAAVAQGFPLSSEASRRLWLRNAAPASGGNGRRGGGWRNKRCERQRYSAPIEPDGGIKRSGGSLRNERQKRQRAGAMIEQAEWQAVDEGD